MGGDDEFTVSLWWDRGGREISSWHALENLKN
jgi:hypothetical protein